jgi:hypothetical protein
MRNLNEFIREHPVFFWGIVAIIVALVVATLVVGLRAPQYRMQAAILNEEMTEQERATRDRILDSRARRGELAVALLQREIRMKAMQQKGLHLAISVEDSTLYLRHGPATLRQVPVRIGADSIIRAPDGRQWRFVRGLGERHVVEKQTSPAYEVPEWVYIGRGEPVPDTDRRTVAGGLGRYVLRLSDGTEIYSEPTAGPLADAEVNPGAFMVPEQEFRAIFDAIRRDIPVFIY